MTRPAGDRRLPRFGNILRAVLQGLLWSVCAGLFSTPANAEQLQLISQLDLPGGGGVTDVWGYVDGGGREYALVGNNWTGIQVVEVTNPYNPVLVATIPSVPRQDIKSWQHYVYTVDGNLNHAGANGAILDFSNPVSPVVVGSIPAGHNLFIDEDGYLYLSYPGLKIFDLNPDPTAPQLVWADSLSEGHDACVVNGRLYDFSGTEGTFIYDVTNPASPIKFGEITDPTISFHHSGWVSADGNFLFLNDELAFAPTPDITVWLVSHPWTIAKVGAFSDNTATVHNSYVVGNFLLAAYYTSGLRLIDVSLPFAPVMMDEYDTSPLSGEGSYLGAWGCYAFSPSGNIFVSDRSNGLFIFDVTASPTGVPPPSSQPVEERYRLAQNRPNPFNPVTTIRFHIPSAQRVDLRIYSATGRVVRKLLAGIESAGDHDVQWDGHDDAGNPLASGVYFYRLRSGSFDESKRLVLLK